MGWDFTKGATKHDIVDDILGVSSWENGEVYHRTLHHALVTEPVYGSVLWTLEEKTSKADGRISRYIGCYLLDKQAGFGWGYKAIDETMGPVAKNCPLTLLDQTTEPINEWAREWRERVRAHHAETMEVRP